MSMESKETYTCPECGHEQECTVWHSLNGDMNPEAKQQLLDGTLFLSECSNCGRKSNLDYGILYHDMTNQAMVYYVDEESVNKTLEIMKNSGKQFGLDMSGYRNRIVTDQNSLREKAIIFDHGLDDRVVEIIKLIYYINAEDRFSDAKINAVYFLVADGKYILEFLGEKPLSAEVPAEMYDNIKHDFAERLERVGNENAFVDLNWASEILKG